MPERSDPRRRIQYRRPSPMDAGYASAWAHIGSGRRFFAPVAQVEQPEGMGINVYLCSQQGVPLHDDGGALIIPFGVLPAMDDPRSPILRFIDPYDDTMFNSIQASVLRTELLTRSELAADEGERLSIERIAALAERCAEERLHLWFIGD